MERLWIGKGNCREAVVKPGRGASQRKGSNQERTLGKADHLSFSPALDWRLFSSWRLLFGKRLHRYSVLHLCSHRLCELRVLLCDLLNSLLLQLWCGLLELLHNLIDDLRIDS